MQKYGSDRHPKKHNYDKGSVRSPLKNALFRDLVEKS